MPSGIRPTVDYAFKRVFGCEENKSVLVDLLNAVLLDSGQTPIRDVQILNPFSLQDAADDRVVILDIKARDKLGRETLIEMQMMSHRAFRERLMFELAVHYSQSLREGEDFVKLKPVIVVCFIDSLLCPETSDYHSRYELRNPTTGNLFSNHWAIHIIELPKFDRSPTQLTSAIDRWSYFLKHGAEFDLGNLPVELQTPPILQATGTLITMSQNTIERDQYNARRLFLGDQATRFRDALEIGREEGREMGRQEGREEGRELALRSLLTVGTSRLGPAPPEIQNRLQQLRNIDQIRQLLDRSLDCQSWESLIAGDAPTP